MLLLSGVQLKDCRRHWCTAVGADIELSLMSRCRHNLFLWKIYLVFMNEKPFQYAHSSHTICIGSVHLQIYECDQLASYFTVHWHHWKCTDCLVISSQSMEHSCSYKYLIKFSVHEMLVSSQCQFIWNCHLQLSWSQGLWASCRHVRGVKRALCQNSCTST